jgi:cysteine desulfurase family protein (TIGR01976 family)
VNLEPHLPFIRSQFPALEGPWAFFDNAGGSMVLRSVADRARDYLLSTSVQLGASYRASVLAGERVLEGNRAAARLLNAGADEVVVGSSATQLLGNLSSAMARSIRPGDEIVVTNSDHEANVGAWLRLARQGATIRFWEINRESLALELDDLRRLLSERTRLVAFTHASNVLGSINPVTEIARLAHGVGARVLVDGVAYAPHRPVDVKALDVEYYVCSLYKVYGPHVSVLFGKREHLLALDSLNHYFIGADAIPYKLQPGNLNFELTYALGGITGYLDELGARVGGDSGTAWEAIAAHEALLAERLLSFLRSRPDIRIIGQESSDPARRVPTVSFVVPGRHSSEVPLFLDERQVAVRYGDFYARRLIETLGLSESGGVVRVSFVHYNTLEEVDRLVGLLEEWLARHPNRAAL